MQLQTLIAYFYLRGLDFFGGMPIFHHTDERDIPRATDVETFNHVEKLLLEAIPKLPIKVNGTPEDGLIRKAAAATLLAQLYFNAESYTGTSMFDKCEVLCQDIIDGKYGQYALEQNWFGPFHFDNHNSTEIIWSAVSENNQYMFNWYWSRFYPYEAYKYFNIETTASNGKHLQPSLKPNGQLYEYKLGKAFSKFHNNDLRKKPYVYRGNKTYEGMFLMGVLRNPITGISALGVEEYKGQALNMIDQVAHFKKVGTEYSSVEDLPSTMSTGEENSGIRIVKFPQPNLAEKSIRFNSDYPVIRLAEIYYMLGECKFRKGDLPGASALFNQVRARNFASRIDPDPVTPLNIDKYRILDEWMIEFLGEGRRRTDLIRWDAFTKEEWWDHKPTINDYLKRFPVPTSAISGSNILKQNPGYN